LGVLNEPDALAGKNGGLGMGHQTRASAASSTRLTPPEKKPGGTGYSGGGKGKRIGFTIGKSKGGERYQKKQGELGPFGKTPIRWGRWYRDQKIAEVFPRKKNKEIINKWRGEGIFNPYWKKKRRVTRDTKNAVEEWRKRGV